MSDAATPPGAPAGGGTDATVDAAMALLGPDLRDEDGHGEDIDAAGAPTRQATPAADAAGAPSPGDDDSETTDPEPQTEAPEPTYRVKVRGEERDVTLSELRNGYSRTEDYKAKTAEVAEQRRAVEQAKAVAQTRVQQLDALLSLAPLDPIIAEGMQTDWNRLAQDDPLAYTQRRAAFDERMQRVQVAVNQRQQIAQEQTGRQLAAGFERLVEKIPDWANATKRVDLQKRIHAMASQTYGFKPEDLAGITDHRIVMMMRDALIHHEQQAQRTAADAKRVAPPPARVIRPGGGEAKGASGSERARALEARAIRTGRIDDQVNAVMAIIGAT